MFPPAPVPAVPAEMPPFAQTSNCLAIRPILPPGAAARGARGNQPIGTDFDLFPDVICTPPPAPVPLVRDGDAPAMIDRIGCLPAG